jgi:MATE family multidrug resistance protein
LAVSLIFDASDMIFSSAIKGAGDTLFVMKGVIFFSVFIIVIPTYFAVVKFDQKIYQAWGYFLLYSIAPAVCFYFRYKCNKWIKKRIYY